MNNAIFKIPRPSNEPIFSYIKNSKERVLIEKELEKQSNNIKEIPIIINGEKIFTNKISSIICPHNHKKIIAKVHNAEEKNIKDAINTSLEAKKKWSNLAWEERASIFNKAAEILASRYRYILNAATMLGQSKTIYQAEIDAVCELIDFWRFNSYFLNKIYSEQPESASGVLNRIEYRALEGFIYAISPFNFTSIGGNLASAPALIGNTVLWKPSKNSVLSSYYIMEILELAGLPNGVINFIPGDAKTISNIIFNDENFAGVHFTGSTEIFNSMWKTIANNISNYKYYPRIVGETGGKDFIFAYNDCDIDELVTASIRGAFEYQGQKCSAASRMYVPKSIYSTFKEKLINTIKTIKTGDVSDFSNFMGAVIDKNAYNNIKAYIDYAFEHASIIAGGNCNSTNGYFIEPTVIETTDPYFKTMVEEIFGPVLTIYAYDDVKLDETLEILNTSSKYALTGAIFAKDRYIINYLTDKLKDAAGNFYINDKPTGAVVGQQPFGGLRASGTNDKAGSYLNLLRWTSPRTIKETYASATDYSYPFMV